MGYCISTQNKHKAELRRTALGARCAAFVLRAHYAHLYLTINMRSWQKIQCLTYKNYMKVIPSKKKLFCNM